MSKFLEQEKANRARRKTDNMSMKEILVVKNVPTKNTPGSELGEMSITSDTQMIPPLWQKAKRN